MNLIDWKKIYLEQSAVFEEKYKLLEDILENENFNELVLETTFWVYKGFFKLAEIEYLYGYILSKNYEDTETNCFRFENLFSIKESLETLLEAWEHSNNARKLKDTKNIEEYTKNSLLASVTSDYVFQRGEKNLEILKKRNIGIFSPVSKDMKTYFGFDIKDAYLIIDYVMRNYEESVSNIRNKLIAETKGDESIFLSKLPSIDKSSFIITVMQCADDTGLNSSVIEKMFDMFTNNEAHLSERIKYPTDYNVFKEYPIISMSDGYVFPCITTLHYELSHKLTQSLIDNPDTKDNFIKKRGDYLEREVNDFFADVLNDAQIYTSLYYYVIEDGVEKRCELDHLIIYDTNVFIVESKSGRFSKPARRGAYGSFKNEIQENIEYAFKQAKRTKDFIFEHEVPKFFDGMGREVRVELNKGELLNWFLMNVTLENFGEVATNLSTLKEIGIYEYNEFPWSVNLNDLDKIYQYLNHPSQFIHYVHRRLQSINNTSNKVIVFYELDYLYHYLNHNIFFDDREKDIIFLESGGENILNDAIINGEDLSVYKQNIPAEFLQIIESLEESRPLGYSDVILNIHELSQEGRLDFIDGFKKGISEFKPGNTGIEIILETEKILFHIYVSETSKFDEEKWYSLTYLRHYQAKYKKMLCFIKYIDMNENDLFNGYLLLQNREWVEDLEMDEISNKIGDYRLKSKLIK